MPTYFNQHGQVIGHDAGDVMNWLAAQPGYDGWIWFDNGDGGDQVEVSEIFFVDDDAEAMITRPAATAAGSVSLLEAVRDAETAPAKAA
ncbi:MAG TPA: hypothetical protein VGV07_22420 [Devosia sp.]|jgi:hypothetical protein|uniref:hypothetical protein n=1 Tax=Devosia sp. TaxID=1871048 RepID=UPI002DDD515E|nr:hypothetical protein [Devosia sp.]HEV2518023.1 hypothetical protein [Devosia sp.]